MFGTQIFLQDLAAAESVSEPLFQCVSNHNRVISVVNIHTVPNGTRSLLAERYYKNIYNKKGKQ